MGDGNRGDQRVVGPRRRLTAGAAQRCSDPAERSGRGGVEGERVEISLRLLHVRLPGGLLFR